jgi:hypothetical protein
MNVEELWAAQLQREHAEISWYHQAKLDPVVIVLKDMMSTWGSWEPFQRTIAISTRLIREHSWDVVLQVLKHEMAHQYVSEVFCLTGDTTHGDAFQRACKRLGVAPWACGAAGEIPEHIPTLRERVLSADDEKLLGRVEKLLSLAQSSNEHEALLAMERVRELYTRHNLKRLKNVTGDDGMDSLYLGRKKKKTDQVETKILSILNQHFKVRVIHTNLFDAVDCQRYKAAEVLGRRENVILAEYVFHFLLQQCESLWMSHRHQTKCIGSMRRSYQLGVLCGFDEKLKNSSNVEESAAKAENLSASDMKSLRVLERSEMDTFVAERYPRLAKKSYSRGFIDANSFASGQSAGRSLNLNRPLRAAGGFGGFLSGSK